MRIEKPDIEIRRINGRLFAVATIPSCGMSRAQQLELMCKHRKVFEELVNVKLELLTYEEFDAMVANEN